MSQKEVNAFVEAFNNLMELDEELFLSTDNYEALVKIAKDGLSEASTEVDMVQQFRDAYLSASDVHGGREALEEFKTAIENNEAFSDKKKEFLLSVWNKILEMYDEAAETYIASLHAYSITLPIVLDEGTIAPTYAHDTDACADLYAKEDMVIPAHSISNKIDTGVHIALPEGWKACVVPRSSIGAKTGLRLSNMVAQIDVDYRGSIIILYDNISDSDYRINAGDRIAQMWVEPTYHFRASIVDHLDDTDRGSGGLGSSGR